MITTTKTPTNTAINSTFRSDVQETELPHIQTAAKPASHITSWLKRNAFNLHRWISIVALVPALVWSLSGTSHPFMAHWFKPPIAKEFLPPQPITAQAVTMSLAEVLRANRIASIQQFRLVEFQKATWFQVQLVNAPERLYFNTHTGTRLQGGDEEYAVWLAKQYLGNPNATITDKRIITRFDDEYRSINRLLPVWKISFHEGGYDVYVETSSGRMATYTTPARRAFLWVFQYMHNWGWLNGAETLRFVVIVLLLSVIIAASLSGIALYIFLWGKGTKRTVNGLRKYHRSIGIAVSLSTLTFASSGMYHALHKDRLRDEAGQPSIQEASTFTAFKAEELNFGTTQAALVPPPLFDVSAVRINGEVLYRFAHSVKVGSAANDCCTPLQTTNADTKGVKPARIRAATYINARTQAALPHGDARYARYVAAALAGVQEAVMVRETLVTEFKGEYGFVNKRLPVQRIDIASADKRALYVETATGTLAADVRDSDRLEGFSFAYVHKLEFLKPLGADVRDGAAVALGFTNSLVAVLGLVLFMRRR
jgi:hypothetical protein